MVAAFALGVASLIAVFVTVGQGRPIFAFPLAMFGLVALSGGVGDRRMLRAGGLQGTARLKRHLWRMCTALAIAAASFFLGPVSRVPEPLRALPFRLIPLAVLLTMAYWLWRYAAKRRVAAPTISLAQRFRSDRALRSESRRARQRPDAGRHRGRRGGA
jgi:hypothetical protein